MEKLDSKTKKDLEIKAKKQEKRNKILKQLNGIGKNNNI